jgi:hypothetical protein
MFMVLSPVFDEMAFRWFKINTPQLGMPPGTSRSSPAFTIDHAREGSVHRRWQHVLSARDAEHFKGRLGKSKLKVQKKKSKPRLLKLSPFDFSACPYACLSTVQST